MNDTNCHTTKGEPTVPSSNPAAGEGQVPTTAPANTQAEPPGQGAHTAQAVASHERREFEAWYDRSACAGAKFTAWLAWQAATARQDALMAAMGEASRARELRWIEAFEKRAAQERDMIGEAIDDFCDGVLAKLKDMGVEETDNCDGDDDVETIFSGWIMGRIVDASDRKQDELDAFTHALHRLYLGALSFRSAALHLTRPFDSSADARLLQVMTEADALMRKHGITNRGEETL